MGKKLIGLIVSGLQYYWGGLSKKEKKIKVNQIGGVIGAVGLFGLCAYISDPTGFWLSFWAIVVKIGLPTLFLGILPMLLISRWWRAGHPVPSWAQVWRAVRRGWAFITALPSRIRTWIKSKLP